MIASIIYDNHCGISDVAFRTAPSIGGLSCFTNFRPEVDNNVICGVAVDYVGVDVTMKFGDSRSNGSRDIRGANFVSNE